MLLKDGRRQWPCANYTKGLPLVISIKSSVQDSWVEYSLDKEDPDILVMTCSCVQDGGQVDTVMMVLTVRVRLQVVATRRFRRCKEDQLRRISVI